MVPVLPKVLFQSFMTNFWGGVPKPPNRSKWFKEKIFFRGVPSSNRLIFFRKPITKQISAIHIKFWIGLANPNTKSPDVRFGTVPQYPGKPKFPKVFHLPDSRPVAVHCAAVKQDGFSPTPGSLCFGRFSFQASLQHDPEKLSQNDLTKGDTKFVDDTSQGRGLQSQLGVWNHSSWSQGEGTSTVMSLEQIGMLCFVVQGLEAEAGSWPQTLDPLQNAPWGHQHPATPSRPETPWLRVTECSVWKSRYPPVDIFSQWLSSTAFSVLCLK